MPVLTPICSCSGATSSVVSSGTLSGTFGSVTGVPDRLFGGGAKRGRRRIEWGGSSQQAVHAGGGEGLEGVVLALLDLAGAVDAELAVLDLVVQLEDRVDEHLRPRRAPGEVHVHRDDVVDALDDRVVVEHAARTRAHAHREHP